MPTDVDHARLALANAKFEPMAQVLDQLSKQVEREHGRWAVLEQTSPMQQIGQNACTVRYSLRHLNEVRLSLTFIVVGEEADLVLLQGHECSGSRDIRANPEQTDQHVYRFERLDEIKKAVQGKIRADLETQKARGTLRAG